MPHIQLTQDRTIWAQSSGLSAGRKTSLLSVSAIGPTRALILRLQALAGAIGSMIVLYCIAKLYEVLGGGR